MTVRNWCFACTMIVLSLPQMPQSAQAEGIFSMGGPDAGTPEYYEYYSNLPVGSRQRYYKGKLWPPRPRPTGHKQLAVHKYHSAHFWPHPYVCQDRALVESTIYSQVENGWINATTFYDYHFDPETNQLNTAGRRHLRYIITSVPEQFRNSYVTAAFDPLSTQARVESVESSIAALTGQQQMLTVEIRTANPLWRNATMVDGTMRASVESMPPPTIEYQGVAAD